MYVVPIIGTKAQHHNYHLCVFLQNRNSIILKTTTHHMTARLALFNTRTLVRIYETDR